MEIVVNNFACYQLIENVVEEMGTSFLRCSLCIDYRSYGNLQVDTTTWSSQFGENNIAASPCWET